MSQPEFIRAMQAYGRAIGDAKMASRTDVFANVFNGVDASGDRAVSVDEFLRFVGRNGKVNLKHKGLQKAAAERRRETGETAETAESYFDRQRRDSALADGGVPGRRPRPARGGSIVLPGAGLDPNDPSTLDADGPDYPEEDDDLRHVIYRQTHVPHSPLHHLTPQPKAKGGRVGGFLGRVGAGFDAASEYYADRTANRQAERAEAQVRGRKAAAAPPKAAPAKAAPARAAPPLNTRVSASDPRLAPWVVGCKNAACVDSYRHHVETDRAKFNAGAARAPKSVPHGQGGLSNLLAGGLARNQGVLKYFAAV